MFSNIIFSFHFPFPFSFPFPLPPRNQRVITARTPPSDYVIRECSLIVNILFGVLWRMCQSVFIRPKCGKFLKFFFVARRVTQGWRFFRPNCMPKRNKTLVSVLIYSTILNFFLVFTMEISGHCPTGCAVSEDPHPFPHTDT